MWLYTTYQRCVCLKQIKVYALLEWLGQIELCIYWDKYTLYGKTHNLYIFHLHTAPIPVPEVGQLHPAPIPVPEDGPPSPRPYPGTRRRTTFTPPLTRYPKTDHLHPAPIPFPKVGPPSPRPYPGARSWTTFTPLLSQYPKMDNRHPAPIPVPEVGVAVGIPIQTRAVNKAAWSRRDKLGLILDLELEFTFFRGVAGESEHCKAGGDDWET